MLVGKSRKHFILPSVAVDTFFALDIGSKIVRFYKARNILFV